MLKKVAKIVIVRQSVDLYARGKALVTRGPSKPAIVGFLKILANRPFSAQEIEEVIQHSNNASEALEFLEKKGVISSETAGPIRIMLRREKEMLEPFLPNGGTFSEMLMHNISLEKKKIEEEDYMREKMEYWQ